MNDNFNYYKVVSGDTLYNIANKNNINASLLALLNGLNESDYIYPNQVLLVPKNGSKIYVSSDGDTLMDVCEKFGVDVVNLINQNKNIYLQEGQLILYRGK